MDGGWVNAGATTGEYVNGEMALVILSLEQNGLLQAGGEMLGGRM
ncbi:MAG: hypothetical protein IRD7MM_06830 [Candidatus Midichloria mitochondrii]|nr:hypothetical protein [Candidatus Midichloria mitochondrii]